MIRRRRYNEIINFIAKLLVIFAISVCSQGTRFIVEVSPLYPTQMKWEKRVVYMMKERVEINLNV